MSDIHIGYGTIFLLFSVITIFFYLFHAIQYFLVFKLGHFFSTRLLSNTSTITQITIPFFISSSVLYIIEMFIFSLVEPSNLFFFFVWFYSPIQLGFILFIVGMTNLMISRYAFNSKGILSHELTKKQIIFRFFILTTITFILLTTQKLWALFPKHFWAAFIVIQSFCIFLISKWNQKTSSVDTH